MNEYSGILPTFESLHCEFIGVSFGYCLDMPLIEHDTVCASNPRCTHRFSGNQRERSPLHVGELAYVEAQAKDPIHRSGAHPRRTCNAPQAHSTFQYGGNPTGTTATKERRQEVLALAREHNFLILEGDPARISSPCGTLTLLHQMTRTTTCTSGTPQDRRRTSPWSSSCLK